MIHCAKERNAELVIVSRDSDYGATFDNKAYINDHLRQEFSERVSKKRSLLLYSRLAEALKHFSVRVTPAEEKAEAEIVSTAKVVYSSPSSAASESSEFNSLPSKLLRQKVVVWPPIATSSEQRRDGKGLVRQSRSLWPSTQHTK